MWYCAARKPEYNSSEEGWWFDQISKRIRQLSCDFDNAFFAVLSLQYEPLHSLNNLDTKDPFAWKVFIRDNIATLKCQVQSWYTRKETTFIKGASTKPPGIIPYGGQYSCPWWIVADIQCIHEVKQDDWKLILQKWVTYDWVVDKDKENSGIEG